MHPRRPVRRKDLNPPNTQQTRKSAAAADLTSMFNNATNTNITDSSISMTTNINTGDVPSLDVLHKRVAPNAILNAGGRVDEVRCHPGTREEVIGRIEQWGNTQDGQTAPILWLSGPAGAGKTAIIQTIAERCEQRGVPHANFFFFRGDSSRNHASPLIATLLYQMISLYPRLRHWVVTLISADPLILDSTMENQLKQLILAPLRSVQRSSPVYFPLILLIDGLDECESESSRNQQQILHAFDKIMSQDQELCPFRLLVASRAEFQITMAFRKISSQYIALHLGDEYSPESDIRLFVHAQFELVRKTHPLCHTLNATWPSLEDVEYIVVKSSGQFIYAATVMRFISDSSASPLLSLERVKGATQLATISPFSHVDAIYAYILSQSSNQEEVRDILHAQLVIQKFTAGGRLLPWLNTPTKLPVIELLERYDRKYTEVVVLSCLADLTPILRYSSDSGELQFYHASFSDFLWDRSRSGDYSVDSAAFNYQAMPSVWKDIHSPWDSMWLHFGLWGIDDLKKLPPGLMAALVSAKNIWPLMHLEGSSILNSIYNLCITDDDFTNFKHIIRQWINGLDLDDVTFKDIEHVPFSRRYFYMARGEHYWAALPDKEMITALCSETDFDRHESAIWLSNLLHHIYREIYHCNPKYYTQLVHAWISWAIDDHISCPSLQILPDTQLYIRNSATTKWGVRNFGITSIYLAFVCLLCALLVYSISQLYTSTR